MVGAGIFDGNIPIVNQAIKPKHDVDVTKGSCVLVSWEFALSGQR